MGDSGTDGWIRVPVGDGAERWATRGRSRRVLVVVHNVTSASRLLDVLPLFHDDLRVQLLLTCTGSSPFQAGVRELFAASGLPVLPWEQARETPVDLVLTASFGGQLDRFTGRLAVLSHGIGYTKRLATPDTGHLSSPPPVFGASPEWLLKDGVPIADALVLSHPEQLDRLRAACPEAAGTAVLAGDPCFDRMLAARPYRERFRRALGVRRGQRLVVLNSTWNPDSLFGDSSDNGDGEGSGDGDALPLLLPRLTAELPADEYRLVAILHPNIWHGHGPGQIRAWLDRARRGGLTLIDPLEGWRQALIAADAVIGDHGSVTYYAAALGTPVLLGAAPLSGLDEKAPLADFVQTAPRLVPHASPRAQLETLFAEHRPRAVTASSMSGSAPAGSPLSRLVSARSVSVRAVLYASRASRKNRSATVSRSRASSRFPRPRSARPRWRSGSAGIGPRAPATSPRHTSRIVARVPAKAAPRPAIGTPLAAPMSWSPAASTTWAGWDSTALFSPSLGSMSVLIRAI